LELDDLDIDFAHSITVVEWGRGLVEQLTESWLDVEIERPQGAGSVESESKSDEADIEPRTVTIVGHGPRWVS
jgi:tRNA A37 threonylcarbamoyladenosine biosynthesis protein TsaE